MTPSRLVCCCALLAFCGAHAQSTETAWTGREQIAARFERIGEAELKALFLHCSRESSQRMLDFEEAARCSIALEVLKRRCFGGDFNALLAWWRERR